MGTTASWSWQRDPVSPIQNLAPTHQWPQGMVTPVTSKSPQPQCLSRDECCKSPHPHWVLPAFGPWSPSCIIWLENNHSLYWKPWPGDSSWPQKGSAGILLAFSHKPHKLYLLQWGEKKGDMVPLQVSEIHTWIFLRNTAASEKKTHGWILPGFGLKPNCIIKKRQDVSFHFSWQKQVPSQLGFSAMEGHLSIKPFLV